MLGGIERVEDPLKLVLGDALPIVPEAKNDFVRLRRGGYSNIDPAGEGREGVDAVLQNIQEYLLQL
ncbi:hypothetical protein D3C81_2182480 [compost metagenome]